MARLWLSAAGMAHLEEKAALMAEVEAEGGQVSVVAQRHGISKSLLYNWRSAWKAAGLAARARAVPPAEFVQLGVVADASGQGPMMPMTTGAVCPRGTGLAFPYWTEPLHTEYFLQRRL